MPGWKGSNGMLGRNGLNISSLLQRLSLLLLTTSLLVISGCTTDIPPSSPASATATPDVITMLEQRPVRLPVLTPGSRCPKTPARHANPHVGDGLGAGPIYVGSDAGVLYYTDAQHFLGGGSDWGGVKTFWLLGPTFTGEALIRGHQIDGPHGMRFGSGAGDAQLELDALTPPDWYNHISYTRFQSPGCYAYQVDGLNFSYIIIFQAVLMPVPG